MKNEREKEFIIPPHVGRISDGHRIFITSINRSCEHCDTRYRDYFRRRPRLVIPERR
jgi:hypothetical protein